jgi:hypothetical protein
VYDATPIALSGNFPSMSDTYFSTGSNLREYVSSGTRAGDWQIKGSGVSAFSAGVGSGGNAVVFADVNGDLREFSGTKGHVTSTEVQNGDVISFSASRYAADTVFMDWESELWQASGRGTKLTWEQVQ